MRLLPVLLLASILLHADEKPKPPLELVAPAPPSSTWRDQDLTKADPDELRAEAKSLAYEDSLPAEAVQLQHWAVVAKPERGHYSLACFYALAANPDAAFYWLQYCGMEGEGADPEWALEDPDLESIRSDARWKPMHDYLTACAAWWEKNGAPRTVVTLPQGYAKGTAISALVGLHGLGSMPDDFAGGDDYQQLADRLGAAVIGASGTRCLGKRVFCWSEDPDRDLAREGKADLEGVEVARRIHERWIAEVFRCDPYPERAQAARRLRERALADGPARALDLDGRGLHATREDDVPHHVRHRR